MTDSDRLIAAAREAARHAHAPYSRFAVGAAVLLTDGSVVTGANVENASYGLSLCAETVAVATASAQGRLADIVAVGNDSQFAKFCEVAGRPDIATDARFARNAERVRHRAMLVPMLAALMKTRSRADWLEALEAAKVPCGPINDLAEGFADPHVQARGMTVEMPHPLAGSVRLVSSPMKFSDTPVQYRRPPPLLGEHTTELLREFGLDDTEISALRESHVV